MANEPHSGSRDEESFFLHGLSLPGGGTAANASRPLPADTEDFSFLRELGRGGMGVVYEAQDRRGDRRVAVKIIAPDLRFSEEALQRFEVEARSAAALVHRNCVFVYGAHRVQDSPAIAMELLGETLEDLLRRGEPIATARALRFADDVLRGLEAAHAIGLVHRDVKPSNVFLDDQGRAKIGDFGLTRPSDTRLAITTSGQFLGSPLYASPEQLRGQELDARSDIYSTGALLYALLAGRPPHEARTIGDLAARVATETPRPVEELRPDVPVGLGAVIATAIARAPADRYRDCAAFRQALAPFLGAGPRTASLAHRLGAMVLDLGLLLAIDGLLGFLPEGPSEIASFGIFIGYFGLLEGRQGFSLGKLAMGLRVTTAAGAAPGFGRAAARALAFQLRRPLALVLPEQAVTVIVQVWLLLLFAFARRRNGFRGLHEFATGTRVVSVARARRQRAPSVLRPERAGPPAGREVIGRFRVEAAIGRSDQGELLGARDPRLDRSVWIHLGEAGGPELADLGELRRLERDEAGGLRFEVYEDPGGASLVEYMASGRHLDWPRAREALVHLLQATGGAWPPITRLWIDRDAHLRVLSRAIELPGRGLPEAPPAIAIIRGLLGSERAASWPAEVPDEAARLVGRLLAAPSAEERLALATALAAMTEIAPGLGRGRRLAQIALGIVPLGLHLRDLGLRIDAAESNAEIGRAVLENGGHDLLVIVLPLTILAFLLRDGPDFRLLRIRLVDAEGERASRLLAAARAALSWGPLALASLLAPALGGLGVEAIFVVVTVAALGQIFGAFVNLLRPHIGLQDLVLGTSLERRPRG